MIECCTLSSWWLFLVSSASLLCEILCMFNDAWWWCSRIDTRGLAWFDLTIVHLSLTTTAPSNPLLPTNRKMRKKLNWCGCSLDWTERFHGQKNEDAHTHAHTHACTHTHTRAHTHAHTHACTHTHTRALTHACTHILMCTLWSLTLTLQWMFIYWEGGHLQWLKVVWSSTAWYCYMYECTDGFTVN